MQSIECIALKSIYIQIYFSNDIICAEFLEF